MSWLKAAIAAEVIFTYAVQISYVTRPASILVSANTVSLARKLNARLQDDHLRCVATYSCIIQGSLAYQETSMLWITEVDYVPRLKDRSSSNEHTFLEKSSTGCNT